MSYAIENTAGVVTSAAVMVAALPATMKLLGERN